MRVEFLKHQLPNRELLETSIGHWEKWTAYLGFLAAFVAVLAAISGGFYFVQELRLRHAFSLELGARHKGEKRKDRVGMIAAGSTIAAGIFGFVIAIISLQYVANNQALRKLDAGERLETQTRIAGATTQANSALRQNIELTRQLTAVQRSQAAAADDASKAYAGMIAAKSQLLQLQQQIRVIRTVELEVRFIVATEPTSVEPSVQRPFGMLNYSGLLSRDGQTLYFSNDNYVWEYQQFSPTQRKFRFIYHPYSGSEILGKKVESLTQFTRFRLGYASFFQDGKARLARSPGAMQLLVRVNGVEVVNLSRLVPFGDLLKQNFDIDIEKEFSEIPVKYVPPLASAMRLSESNQPTVNSDLR